MNTSPQSPPTDRSADTPPMEAAPSPGLASGPLIMRLFLVSLSMAFGAVLMFYFVMRARAPIWPPPGTPALPLGLWLSTTIILASSVTMHVAVRGARRDRQTMLCAAMLATLLLAVAFLVSQTVNWLLAVAAKMPPGASMFAITFYLLTGLHALHIAAGLVPLSVVTVRAFRGRYSPASSAGVALCATFWHFVDVIWVIIFSVLQLSQ